MNEELGLKAQNALVEVIESIVKAKDFAVDQAPDTISQLLSYNAMIYIAWTVVWVLCLMVALWGVYRSTLLVKEDDDWTTLVLITAGSALVFIGAIVKTTFGGFIKIWLAPKVWLIEYVVNLTAS